MRYKYFLLIGVLMVGLAIVLAACGQPTVEATPCPTAPACPECPAPPEPEPCPTCPEAPACPEPLIADENLPPIALGWIDSPHNDSTAEAFNHWNEDDPRDDLAYTTLAQWIYRQKVVPVDQRLRLLAVWERNLTAGIGDTGTPAVARRSFSALALGILAILDNEAPYLDRPAFARLLASTLTYLRDEKDVRGFDPSLSWLHSVAHTADLIKFLARSQHLQPADQAHILTAISDKLAAVETPLINGEDERLARAVLSIAARPDFDEAAFVAWLKTVAPQRRAVPPTAATLAIDGNRRNLLVSLFTVLSTDRRDLPTLTRARTLVLDTLKTFM